MAIVYNLKYAVLIVLDFSMPCFLLFIFQNEYMSLHEYTRASFDLISVLLV